MEIKQVNFVGSKPEYQEYNTRDVDLIEQKLISPNFKLNSQDYIEYFIYDEGNSLIGSNYFSSNYSPVYNNPTDSATSALKLNPELDIASFGIDRGSVYVTYNFYTKLFSSSFQDQFWISQISEDRTEIRVQRQDLSNNELLSLFSTYKAEIGSLPYYPDFLLNFGQNKSLIGTNLLFATNGDQASLLVKLYEPLPIEVELKDTFWIVNKIAEPVTYNVSIDIVATTPTSSFNLRGPNYSIDINKKISQTTDLYNYNTLFGLGTGSLATSASFNRIKSLLQEKSIDINVDYSNFSNFIHYSSATERLNNFVYKLQLIEEAQEKYLSSSIVTGSGAIVSRSLQNNLDIVNNIINKFDEYEYYLYYSNDATAWPKYEITTPVQLKVPYSVTASAANNGGVPAAVEWLGNANTTPGVGLSMLFSASVYDAENPNYLVNTLPQYIKDDFENNPAFLFTSMLGQHFDNLYVYYKDITTRYQADNNNSDGISKDLVADALRSFGINLYTNTNLNEDLYYSILGIEPNGSITPSAFPTGSEGGPSGSLNIVSYPTSSVGGTSIQDVQTEIYKRVYHNLPYLLKTKGTERGLRALIACYGIPETMLRINEYGGTNNKTVIGAQIRNTSYDALLGTLSGSTIVGGDLTASVITPWGIVGFDYLTTTQRKVPDTIQFKFNSFYGHPTSMSNGAVFGDSFYGHSTALFHMNTGSDMQFGVKLDYTSSADPQYSPLAHLGITGSAVSGSVYENYGYISLYLSGSAGYKSSSQLYLPIYDPSLFWNLYIYRETSSLASDNGSANRYWLYAESDLYTAQGNPTTGFAASTSIYISASEPSYNSSWNLFNSSSLLSPTSQSLNGVFRGYLGGNNTAGTLGTAAYNGMYQEFRYWRGVPNLNTKNVQTYTPSAYNGNTLTSSLYDCIFRIPLGRDISTASAYFATEISASLLTTYPDGQYAEESNNLAGYDLTSIHPAIVGNFDIDNYGNVTRVPSFYVFVPSASVVAEEFVNGALYGSSFYAANYHTYNRYEMLSSPRSGRYQKVNNKVFVPGTVEAHGDTLSPYVSIQKLDVSQTRNSLDLEVAFSPADQIDDDITLQMGNFDMDEYIGDPASMYSSSYQGLDTLNKFYFSKYISSFNVYDLVRAIKFYDNSLFKMIKDFVPARANLTTGVLVKSHLLERNKIKSYSPEVLTTKFDTKATRLVLDPSGNLVVPIQTIEVTYTGSSDNLFILTGSIDTAFLSSSTPIGVVQNTSYTEVIQGLTGSVTVQNNDGREMFTGRLGGTTITIPSEFKQLVDNSISNTTTTQQYSTYSLNYLQHNITGSVTSFKQADLDYTTKQYTPVNLGLIDSLFYTMSLNPNNTVLKTGFWPYASINDASYESFTHNSARYLGSRTSSSLFNTYSISDNNIPSINRAYGNTAAIGNYVGKMALFTQIVSSSFFFQKNNAAMIYLVDKSGSFTELNKDNLNWEEVQNTFKLGENATIKLFDNQKYSDQKLTDGSNPIFSSGYSYYPTLYYSQSLDTKLYFLKTQTSIQKDFSANLLRSPNSFLSGSPSPTYGFKTSGSLQVVYNTFDNVTSNEGNSFTGGTTSAYPRYTAPEAGTYRFTASMNIATQVPILGASGSYTLSFLKNGSTFATQTRLVPPSTNFLTISSQRVYITSTRTYDDYSYYSKLVVDPIQIKDSSNNLVHTIPAGQYLYILTGSANPCFGPVFGISGEFKVAQDYHVVYATGSTSTAPDPLTIGASIITGSAYSSNNMKLCSSAITYNMKYINSAIVYERNESIDGNGDWYSTATSTLDSSQTFALSAEPTNLTQGDIIEVKLQQDYMSTTNFTSSFTSAGTLGISQDDQVIGLYPFATSSLVTSSFISQSIGTSRLVINSSLSSYYGYQFLPNFSTGSIASSSLFTKYGSVDFPFTISTGDLVVLKENNLYQEYEIQRVSNQSNGAITMDVTPEINTSFLPITDLTEVLFLTKRQDETNVVFNFAKKPGQTSYGLIIPNNISPDVLKNIDSVVKEIQSKLVETNTTLQ